MTAAKPKTPPSRLTSFPGLNEYEAPDKMHEGRVGTADFNSAAVRWTWHEGERWFSVVDVVGVLSEADDPKDYWSKTKARMAKKGEAVETLTKCQRLKLPATDGKMRLTDCANTETLLRLIQSLPTKGAEPFKLWLAKVGQERIEEIEQPSKGVDRAIDAYRKQGRNDPWIDSRLQSVAARNQLTNEWKERGVGGEEIGPLTARMSKEMLGVTPAKHKEMKGLPAKGVEVRDQMDRLELAFTTLGEQSAVALITGTNAQGSEPTKEASMAGAAIAGAARRTLEEKLGRPVANGSNFLVPPVTTPELPAPSSEHALRVKGRAGA